MCWRQVKVLLISCSWKDNFIPFWGNEHWIRNGTPAPSEVASTFLPTRNNLSQVYSPCGLVPVLTKKLLKARLILISGHVLNIKLGFLHFKYYFFANRIQWSQSGATLAPRECLPASGDAFGFLQLVHRCYQHLVSRSQGCRQRSHNVRDSPQNKELSGPKCQQSWGWETLVHPGSLKTLFLTLVITTYTGIFWKITHNSQATYTYESLQTDSFPSFPRLQQLLRLQLPGIIPSADSSLVWSNIVT